MLGCDSWTKPRAPGTPAPRAVGLGRPLLLVFLAVFVPVNSALIEVVGLTCLEEELQLNGVSTAGQPCSVLRALLSSQSVVFL